MDTTQQIDTIILKFFSKNCTNEERSILLTWLKENDENKKHFLQLQNIWQVANPAFKPDEIDVDKAYKAVYQKNNKSIPSQRTKITRVVLWWQKIAAILLIPIVGFTLFQNIILLNPLEVVAFQEISSPVGLNSEITLPDSSRVWLNSGSKLKFPVKFDTDEREVFLNGEAYFEVHADKKHPFIVKTPNLNIVATGTAFNVEAYKNDSIAAVTLLEGKVGVDIANKHKLKLQPNQRMIYNLLHKNYTLHKTDASQWCKWKDGVLAFRNEPLEDVFKRIGRSYNIDFEIKDNVVGKQIYHATFEGETLDEILHLLKLSAPIKYKRIKRVQQENNKFNKEVIEVYSSN